MITDGLKTVADRWRLFEEAVDESIPGDLPQLLQQLKEKTTLTPPPSLMDLGQTSEGRHATPASLVPSLSLVKKEGGIKNKEPIMIMILGHRNWACPQCNTVRGSQNGSDAHIRQAHTGKALVCLFCSFSTYNMYSLQRHEKEHK